MESMESINYLAEPVRLDPRVEGRDANKCSGNKGFPTSEVVSHSRCLGMVEGDESSHSNYKVLGMVETSHPIIEDRNSYSSRVVEGHQRETPSPKVTDSNQGERARRADS